MSLTPSKYSVVDVLAKISQLNSKSNIEKRPQ